MKHPFFKVLQFSFIVFWICFLFVDYMDKHPEHVIAYEKFKYFDLLLILQLLGIFLFTIVNFINNEKIKRIYYTGLSFVILVLFFTVVIFNSFDKYIGEETSFLESIHVLIRVISYILALSGVYLSSISTGNFVLKKVFKFKIERTSILLATGIAIITMLLFGIGALGILYSYIVIPVLLLPFIIEWKFAKMTLENIFIKPFEGYDEINYWGFIMSFILILVLTINFTSVLSPIPYGFDARNYYLNIPNLMSESNSLVFGYQPCNWQIFMSLGFIVFGSHEVSILFGLFSFILCIIAINEIAKIEFKIDINYRLLLILILAVTPAIYSQVSLDVKIDLSLLFYQIVIFTLFLQFLKSTDRLRISYFILFGLFSGFALGIKFTHLYLIATILILYWTSKAEILGLFSSTLIAFGFLLILKIDDIGGLRSSHLGVDFQQWIILLIGFTLLTILFVKKRTAALDVLKFSLLFTFLNVIPMSPWFVKNYTEMQQLTPDERALSPNAILMGKSPGIKMGIRSFDENYKDY